MSELSLSALSIKDTTTTPQQSDIDTIFQQDIIDKIFVQNRNIFLSGSAGTGKSWIIQNIVRPHAERLKLNLALTSTTGVSALSIGGTTIHRWSGIKLGKESADIIVASLQTYKKECLDRWMKCDILVIDEISMLSAEVLELLDAVARKVRRTNRVFGGIRIIASGDFLQLPPVNAQFAYKSPLWNMLQFANIVFTIPKRYPDIDHFNMLQRARLGVLNQSDRKNLARRVDAYIEYIRNKTDKSEKIKPTRIFSLKKDVERFNLDELEKLPGRCTGYNSVDKFIRKGSAEDIANRRDSNDHTSGPSSKISAREVKDYTTFLDNVVTRHLSFKVDAQVMLTYNLCPEMGLVNGSRGVVVDLEQDSANILFKNGITTQIQYRSYEFIDGNIKLIRSQMPLILAWGCSIHKSQGATLDYAIMDLGPSIFAPGMGYVALSRVKTINGILLSSFVAEKMRADPDSLQFEDSISVKKAAVEYTLVDSDYELASDEEYYESD